MAYITNYNFNRIVEKFDTPKDEASEMDDTVIWTLPNGNIISSQKPTPLFAKWDVNNLLLFKAFCKDTKLAAGKFYRKLSKPEDSYRYIQPEKSPSYHENPDCEGLHSDFERITIPEVIREQGKEKVQEFRQWWKENDSLRMDNPKAFVMRINMEFKTSIRDFDIEQKNNSGVKAFENTAIEEINDSIYKKFKDLFSWALEDDNRREIFVRYAYISYIGDNPDKHIRNNTTNFSEKEIKEVLKIIHPKKLEIMKELKTLYRMTYNPKLDIDKHLLDELGFEPCSMCYSGIKID